MSTLNSAKNPSPFDPLDRMPEDEPRFVLRRSDTAAPAAISAWADKTRHLAVRALPEEPSETDQEAYDAKIIKANSADQMALDWKEEQDNAFAVAETKPLYSDIEQTKEQIVLADEEKRRERMRHHLREAAYHASEVRDGMADDLADGDLAQLETIMRMCNRTAEKI